MLSHAPAVILSVALIFVAPASGQTTFMPLVGKSAFTSLATSVGGPVANCAGSYCIGNDGAVFILGQGGVGSGVGVAVFTPVANTLVIPKAGSKYGSGVGQTRMTLLVTGTNCQTTLGGAPFTSTNPGFPTCLTPAYGKK